MSLVGCRLSDVECRLSVVGRRLPDVGRRWPVVECRLSAVECRLSAVECRLSNVGHRSSAAGCRMSPATHHPPAATCRLSPVLRLSCTKTSAIGFHPHRNLTSALGLVPALWELKHDFIRTVILFHVNGAFHANGAFRINHTGASIRRRCDNMAQQHGRRIGLRGCGMLFATLHPAPQRAGKEDLT